MTKYWRYFELAFGTLLTYPAMSRIPPYLHPQFARRTMIQAGAVGVLGLGMNHWRALQAETTAAAGTAAPLGKAKTCIYIFLSGGLAQQDSFDMTPAAPDNVRGEFKPIAT